MNNKISTSAEMLAKVEALSVTCRSAQTFEERAEIIDQMLRVYADYEERATGRIVQLPPPYN